MSYKIDQFYDMLQQGGINMPTKEEFAKNMTDSKYRKTLYEGLQAKGFKQPEYNAYESFWSKNTKPTTEEDLAKTFVMSPEWQEDYARGKEVEKEIKAEDAKRKQTADAYNAYAKLENSFAKYEQSQDVSDLFNVGQQEPILGEDPKKYWRNKVAQRKEGEAQAKAKVDQEREELRQRMQLLKDNPDAWEKSLEQPLQTNAPEVGLRSMESFANGKPVDKRGNAHDNWVSQAQANQRIDAEDKARQLGMQADEIQDMLADPMALDKEMSKLKAELAELTKQRDAYGSQFAKEHPWQMMANLMGRDSFDNPYEVGMYGVDAMETQMQMNNVIARINMLTEAKNAFERGSWSGHGFWNNVKNIGKGMQQFATEINSYTDKYNIESGMALNNLANKIERGEMLTDEEMSWFVTAKLKEEGEKAASQGPTTGAIGYGTPASLEYMVTMAINPARGASKTISDKIIEAGVRRFGKSAFTKMMAKATGMLTEGAVLSTTLGADNVTSDALGRMAGRVGFDDGGNVAVADRVNPLKAMYQSTMASTIGSAVEMMGVPIIGKATKGIGKVATKLADAMSYGKVSKLLSAMDKSQIVNWTKGMSKATGWQGLGEEWGEENVTMLANAIIVGDNEIADMFDTRTQLEILGTCALISGVMSTANVAGFATEFHKVNREFKKAKQEVLRQFSSDVWASLDNLITNAQDEDLTVRLADAMDGMAMNQEQRSAIMNYLTALKRYQKFNELNDGGKFIIGGPQAQATQSTSTSTYEIDSDITLKDEIGNPIDAHIVGRDANGNYMVESSQPINGKRVQPLSADQLDAMVIPNTPDGIQQSEVDGYNMTDANQQAEVSMLTDNARESVATLLGVTPDAVDVTLQQALGDNPTDAKIDARFGDNAQVVKDYLYNVAKTKGMTTRVMDDITDAIEESDKAIDAVANNGNVVTAMLGEEKVNITSGEVVTFDDGVVDKANSSKSVTIKYADGSTEMVAPTTLTEVVVTPVEQAKQQQAQAITQAKQQAFADAMSGALDYSQGQQYTMLNADGSTTDVTILADNGDGNVTVTARDGNKEGGVTDGKQIVLPKSQIQQGVREFKRNQLRGESAQQASIPQAESQPTEVAEPAQEPSMPTDEQGNILYEQMDADSAWDALLAETGGDADMAMTVANEMIADKTKAVEEASKMVAQSGATPQEKIANLKAVKQAQAQAQAELDAWKAIAETPNRRMSLQAEQAEQTDLQGQQVADKLPASEEVTTETPTESESTPQVGLVEDARTLTLGDKTRKMLDAMAKRLGLQVEFVDEVNGGKANADIVGNKVRIAWDKRDQALDFLLGHEFTHRMQDLSPEAYAEFVEATKQALGEEEWNKRINRMKSLYKQHGIAISEQGIIDEVVADYAGELVEERGVFDNFVERNKNNRGLLSAIADVLRSIKEFFTLGKQRKIDNAIARLEALIESASEANLRGDVVNMEKDRYSVSSIFEGTGAIVFNEEGGANIDKDGNFYVIINGKQYDGNNLITLDDIKADKRSVLNMMVEDAIKEGNVTEEHADVIMKKYVDIMNMFLVEGLAENGGYANMADKWMWVGETVYKTVQPNSDKQYTKSIDITTVCKKNEAVIRAMSEMQKRVGYGITPAQILDIYIETQQSGYQVPCPVCYVFSRYLRNGKYASGAILGMEQYGEHLPGGSGETWTADQWVAELRRLEDIDKDKTNKALYNQASADIVEAETLIDKLGLRLQQSNSEAERKELRKQIEKADARYRAALNIFSQSALTSWIKTFAIQGSDDKGYKMRDDAQYPEDIELFKEHALDLRKAGETQTLFPAIQRLRNSGGSSTGKAVGFESNNALGDVISGIATGNNDTAYARASKATTEKEFETNRKKATENFKKASKYIKQQTLRGGQRMWSWSDNIEALMPDVVINLMQLELLGGALQTYSKQLEGVNLVARMGGYVNGSLMAKDNGYTEVTEDMIKVEDGKEVLAEDITETIQEPIVGRGIVDRTRVLAQAGSPVIEVDGKKYVLIFDDVIGIDPHGREVDGVHMKGLFDLNKELSKAGNIIVGMNDTHIRVGLADSRIYFIIPWHASGANNHILTEMFRVLGADISSMVSTDYTDMQSEKDYLPKNDDDKMPKIEQSVRDIWNAHKNETDWKCGIKGGIDSTKETISDSQKHYRELRQAIFDGKLIENKAWLREVQADEFLSQVYDRVQSGTIGNSMTQEDNNHIYPYEYWDTSKTYDEADINGERYIEYCRRLGFSPKFSGIHGKKEYKNTGNFTNDKGYWKLLVDRRMYDIHGKFQDLDPVTSEDYTNELVHPGNTNKEFVISEVADAKATNKIVDRVIDKETSRTGTMPTVDYTLSHQKAYDNYKKEFDVMMADKAYVKANDAVSQAQAKLDALVEEGATPSRIKNATEKLRKAQEALQQAKEAATSAEKEAQKSRFSLTDLTEEEQRIVDEAKANGTYLKAPNGKASNLNERQWIQVRTKAFKDWFGDWENDPENASKVVDENGEPMVVYHGSYWNPLEEAKGKAVFDDSFRGTSSGDNGWFGRGHYFTFGNGKLSKAEARYYGPNVFDAFLDIRNPFMYAETIYKDYNPTNGKSEHNASLVAINTAKAFPNLVEDFQVEQFDSNGDKVDSISIKDYADIFDKVYKEKEFIVEESDEYPNLIIVKADPIEHTDEDLNISWVEYGWEMRMIAPAEREDKQFTFAHHYLTQEVYGREGHSFYILPDRDLKAFSESEEFTSILKERGYDGVLQSAIGDEAVAFEPTQIKSATDNVGTFDASNPDIRYSLATEQVESVLEDYTLNKDNVGDFEYALMQSIAGQSYSARPDYKVLDGVVVRVKGHTPDWDNFVNWETDKAESEKILNVTVGNYEDTDYRRNKEDYESFVEAHPETTAVNVDIEDGTSLADALSQIHEALKAKGIDFEFAPDYGWTKWSEYAAEQTDIEGDYGGERYSLVTDPATIEMLESAPKVSDSGVKLYRAMVEIDGKLYPPMSSMVDEDGKKVLREGVVEGDWVMSDEDLSKAILKEGKDGYGYYFRLLKDDGSYVDARYNPYLHTSDSMLNDQFKSAQSRPNLVVVEMEIPITGDYKAEGAKDAVGFVPGGWKSGDVASQLPSTRNVYLSQYGKVSRIVPTEEVAQHIYDRINGYVDVMPSNVVTPQVREALEKMGVQFVETDNQSVILEGRHKGKSWTQAYGKETIRKREEKSLGKNKANTAVNNAQKKLNKANAELKKAKAKLASLQKVTEGNDGAIGKALARSIESTNNKVAKAEADVATAKDALTKAKANLKKVDKAVNEAVDDASRYSLQGAFYSNAHHAVEDIKQDKATPQQWIAMLKKNGGLKAGEDKWLGLEDWLNTQQGSVTKQEIIDYINANSIKIEEVEYSEDSKYEDIASEIRSMWDAIYDTAEEMAREQYEYEDDEIVDWDYISDNIVDILKSDYGEDILDHIEFDDEGSISVVGEQPIDGIRLEYTTEGLEDKREIALTVPTIDPYNQNDDIHFGDAGGGRAVAWIRFGETEDAEGNRVLVIDEIQSKRHQDGREKGYQEHLSDVEKARMTELKAYIRFGRASEARKVVDFLKSKGFLRNRKEEEDFYYNDAYLIHNGKFDEFVSKYGKEAAELFQTIENRYVTKSKELDELERRTNGVPSAPFEKNWHELAMKRMLRYATDFGFDKLAWTTGEQQAKRYGLGEFFDSIVSSDWGDRLGETDVKEVYGDGRAELQLLVDRNGVIVGDVNDQFNNRRLDEVVGKEIADKLLADGKVELSDIQLRLGGEGMKGFYDKMLPSFMNKYGKKWGVKVGEVTMPNLEEDYQTMHSVDITDAMREDVRKGQPLFSLQGGRSIADKYEKRVNTKGVGGAMHLSKFNFMEATQDGERALKEVQRIIEQDYGIVLESYEDAYKAENALSSVNQAEWERYIKDYYEPMMQIIDKWILKGSETEQSVNHYLIAKSGLERNREFTVRDAFKAQRASAEEDVRADYRNKIKELNDKYKPEEVELFKQYRNGDIDKDTYRTERKKLAEAKKSERTPIVEDYQLAMSKIRDRMEARTDAYKDERNSLRGRLQRGDITYEEFNQLSDEVAIRHAKVEEIKDYSGLTALAKQYNEKDWRNFAERMVVNFENKHDNTDVLWERINNATKKAVEKSYESGITSKEAKDHLDQMFLWYVPMGGMENDTAEDIYSYLNRNADSAFTQTVKRAEGHSEHISDDVMAMIANTMQSAILQGNRNKMKQKFLNMVENYPTDLFTLDRGWVVMQGNEWVESHPEIKADYTAEQVRDAINAHNEEMRNLEEQGLAMSKEGALKLGIPLKNKRNEQEHAISVMRNGQKVTIYVNGNPRVAQALNGKLKDVEQTWIGKAYGNLKRYFSASKTSWNPDFVSSNFSRDIGHSTSMTFVRHGVGEWGKSIVMYAPATATLVAKALGKKSPWGAKYDQYFDEFVRNGGVTGYSHLYSVDDWKIENTKRIDRLRGVAKAIKAHNNLWVNLGKVYNEINSIIENSSRFNEYARSRNRGEDVATSVWNAKEITLNFNKKGSSKTEGLFGGLAFLGRNLVPFFNPIMQGIYQFLKIGKEHKRRMTALCFGYMGMGFFQPFVNAMLVELLGGGDEDDYMKQPEYTRRTNFMLYTGDGYIKIPLAQIFREFYGIGDVVYCAMYGKLSEEDATSQAISQVRRIFSLDDVSTYFDWVADIATNTNFMGNPLWKENDYNKYKPEYTKAYDNTWSFLVSASKWLNEALGGDEHTAPEDFNGKWINPAIWQRVLSELGGGALTSMLDVYDTASALAHGEDVDWANVPIAKRLYTETDEETLQKWIDKEYFSNLDNYKMVRDRMSSLKSSNALDVAEKIDFMYHDPKYLEYVIFDDAQKEIKELRDLADSATDDNRAEREKALYDAELEVVEAIDAVRAMEDNEVQTHMMEHPEVAYYINKDIEKKVKGNVKELQKAIARKEPDARKALTAYRKTPEYKYYNQIRRILKRINKLESRLKDETKNIAPSQRVKMKQKIDGHKKELVELRKAYESIGEIKE